MDDPQLLPYATLRVDGAPRRRSVVVLVNGQPVAQLPTSAIHYEMPLRDIALLTVSVPAEDAELIGIEYPSRSLAECGCPIVHASSGPLTNHQPGCRRSM